MRKLLPISAVLALTACNSNETTYHADIAPLMQKHCVSCHQAGEVAPFALDRKSTRLNSSHRCISYAVFCLKKKKVMT